jgi:hypothetical protein
MTMISAEQAASELPSVRDQRLDLFEDLQQEALQELAQTGISDVIAQREFLVGFATERWGLSLDDASLFTSLVVGPLQPWELEGRDWTREMTAVKLEWSQQAEFINTWGYIYINLWLLTVGGGEASPFEAPITLQEKVLTGLIRLEMVDGAADGLPFLIDNGIADVKVVWGGGIGKQGFPWEEYLASHSPPGSRLPPGFKTFDIFDLEFETALSAKTLNTGTAARIVSPKQVFYALKRSIDAAASFERYTLGGRTLTSSAIASREVTVLVPANTTAAQWIQIGRAAGYAQNRGVTLRVVIAGG